MLEALYAVAVCTAIHLVGKATVGLISFGVNWVVDVATKRRG